MRYFKLSFLAILFLLVFSCSEEVVEKSFVRVPFPELNPEYSYFDFSAQEGGVYTHESGTQIDIPADIWQDAEGNPVTGNVKLKYREFHNAADIFLSGTTLNYDSAGVQEVFTTAGMFELRAYKDSSEIFIKEGKDLEVKMASYQDGSEYNFYSLDEEKQNWEYKGRTNPEVNPEITLIKDSISKLKTEKVFSIEENKFFALNYDGLLDVYFETTRLPFKYDSKLPKRKAKKYGLEYSGIYGYDNVYFRGRQYQAWEMVWETENGKKLPWWTKHAYVLKTTSLGDNSYYMSIKSNKNEKHKTTIKAKAIMPLKYLFAASPESWQAKYDDIMKRIDQEESRLEMQASVFRVFKVNVTGYHNWDVIQKRDNPVFVKSSFDFGKEEEVDVADYDIYYFVNNNKSFVRFNLTQTDTIMLAQDSTAQLIAVLSDTEAAVFDSEAYSNMDFDQLRSNGNYTFKMKPVKINSKDDFLKLLN